MSQSTPTKSRSNLAAKASEVAFGPSRALTSHARRAYERHYAGRHRFARTLFLFDASLLAIAIVLVATAAWFASRPVPPATLAATLYMNTPQSAVGAPITLSVQPLDGIAHRNVTVHWHLPPGTEVLSAKPPLTSDGSAYLGDLAPGQEAASHLVVRLFLPPGAKAEFTVGVLSDEKEGRQELVGTATRIIERSALSAEVPDEFQVTQVTAKGAVIPLRVQNPTDEPLPSVYVLLRKTASHDEQRILLGDMAARETRWIPIPLHETDRIASVAWSLGASGRDLSEGSWSAAVDRSAEFSSLDGRLLSRPGAITHVTVSGQVDDEYVVVHPLLPNGLEVLKPSIDATSLSFEVPASSQPQSTHEWFIAPIRNGPNHSRILGPATTGVISGAFPLSAEVRYRSSAGDQLGVGPNPPRAGFETRYWVFWTVGPLDNELRHITVETDLPPGVEATGNASAVDGGAFTISGKHVSWTLNQLGPHANDDGSVSSEAVFGFEIRTTPTGIDVGRPLQLVATSTAQADDVQTSTVFEGSAGPQTSALPKGGGEPATDGVVLPSTEQ